MDDREAARLYELTAGQGCAEERPVPGSADGGDVTKDDREAAHLYKLAADQGNAVAQVSLGVFYENGRGGLPKDDREAARLFKLAADQGNATGQANLGARHRFGPREIFRSSQGRNCGPCSTSSAKPTC